MNLNETTFEKNDSTSFESLNIDILYELLEYFSFNEIFHSLTDICSHLNWIIFDDSRFHFRGLQFPCHSYYLHSTINETQFYSLRLNHTAVFLPPFINLRSFSLRTQCSHPERLRQMSEELLVLTKLISFKLEITDYYCGDENQHLQDDSHGLVSAAFAHPILQRFILKAPYLSFSALDNRLLSSLPVSISLKYVEIPTFSTSFYFIDPLHFLPVVRHIHFGLDIPHRLDYPHKYLRSLILELCDWPLIALHSFLSQLVVLKKLTVYGFARWERNNLLDYTCLFPNFSNLRSIDMNISIYIQPEDVTIEQFQVELDQERLRNGWKELYITPIVQSRTILKGLLNKK